ncbi:MAG: peptidoglycan glycosyltransferase, partial [Hyphomonadaceae bacterium]|nr:peptidoglycan glycosyltransferase [Clostridia bacterium]
MASSSRITRIRLIYLLVVFTVIPALLICRIGFWQLVAGEGLQKEAIEQQTRDRVVASKRGKILDRNGKQLAVSATVETVSCTPKEVTKSKKQEEIATTLSKLLNMDRDEVLKRITKVSSYEIIKKKVEKDVADQIRQSKLPGIHLDEDSKRYYPYGNFAAQLIGVTGNDNQGLFGIEAKYDRYLKGQPGRIVTATDAQGVEMPYNYERYVNPQEGANVVLAIDEVIQHFVEKHLETAVLDNKVEKGGAAIVMDPKTGEILAMAVKPDFDLNAPFTLKPEVQ